jgi:hypothetical protein
MTVTPMQAAVTAAIAPSGARRAPAADAAAVVCNTIAGALALGSAIEPPAGAAPDVAMVGFDIKHRPLWHAESSSVGGHAKPLPAGSWKMVRFRVRLPAHPPSHLLHASQFETEQSYEHTAVLQSCDSTGLAASQSARILEADASTFFVRLDLPPPHSAEHASHGSHALSTHAESHGEPVHLRVCVSVGHGFPDGSARRVMLRAAV